MARTLLAAASVLAALVILAVAPGCSSGHTVVVQLQTDLAPGLEFDEVFLQATGIRSRRASLSDDYGHPVQLAEIGGVADDTNVAVEVSLRLAGREVVARRVQRHVTGDALIAVIITRNCVEIACPAPGAPTATECRDGLCVTPDCEDQDTCVPAECSSDAQCSSSVACVSPRCALGVCLETPDSSRCAAGEVCSPGLGCVPAIAPDAAGPDAGALDAASAPPDAFSPDAFTPGPSFTLHRLPTGGTVWSEETVGGSVPTDEVEGAFSGGARTELIVLTHTEIFVLDLATRTFTERHDRNAILPEMADVRIQDAYVVNTTLFVTARDVWIYEWNHAGRTATFDSMVLHDDLGADWRGPLAPPWWDMYAAFYVPNNADGWARPDAALSPCGAAAIDGYGVFLSWDGFGPAAMIETIYDATCFQFVARHVYGSDYTPFTLPGRADDPFTIDAIAWADGLWMFTSPR